MARPERRYNWLTLESSRTDLVSLNDRFGSATEVRREWNCTSGRTVVSGVSNAWHGKESPIARLRVAKPGTAFTITELS